MFDWDWEIKKRVIREEQGNWLLQTIFKWKKQKWNIFTELTLWTEKGEKNPSGRRESVEKSDGAQCEWDKGRTEE